MLAVGIPAFRLPRKLLNAEIDRLRAIGIEIKLNTPVGHGIAFDELQKEFAAVFVAIGAHVERKLRIPGEDLPGVIGGVDFLRRVNLGKAVTPGQKVLVIGGGNSALDAARTALRSGAGEVTIVYRRTRAEMPADQREVEDAEREGIKLMFLVAPKAFKAGRGGRVAGLECLKMKLGPPDASGRPAPVSIPNSEFVLPCDAVIATIGQSPDVGALGERLGLETTKWGTLAADPLTLETGLPGVFAGGDCVTGPDVVIHAQLAGKKAAISIDRWLNHQDLRGGRELEGPYHTEYEVDTQGVLMQRQIPVPSLDPATRGKTFAEVHVGYTAEEAIAEAKRCLACGICSDCHLCETACQAHAIDYLQREEKIELQVRLPGQHYPAHLAAHLRDGLTRAHGQRHDPLPQPDGDPGHFARTPAHPVGYAPVPLDRHHTGRERPAERLGEYARVHGHVSTVRAERGSNHLQVGTLFWIHHLWLTARRTWPSQAHSRRSCAFRCAGPRWRTARRSAAARSRARYRGSLPGPRRSPAWRLGGPQRGRWHTG